MTVSEAIREVIEDVILRERDRLEVDCLRAMRLQAEDRLDRLVVVHPSIAHELRRGDVDLGSVASSLTG